MTPQEGEGIRTTGAVVQGGTMTVEVGPNDSTVEVSVGSSEQTQSIPVPPGKTAVIPVPNVPAGTVLWVSVGKGLRRRTILVEVVALLP